MDGDEPMSHRKAEVFHLRSNISPTGIPCRDEHMGAEGHSLLLYS